MNDTNLQIIRAACIKANPEIVALKDGCKVELAPGADFHTFQELNNFSEGWLYGAYVYPGRFSGPKWVEVGLIENHPKWFKIVGRPIRLADVLLAVDATIKDPQSITIGEYNAHNDKVIRLLGTYNLRKDDLTEQSEETLQFLADLLK